MLVVHCGWPRTGTTSLQVSLFEHRDRLAQAGLVYPDRWLGERKPAHHGLDQLLEASLESEAAFDDFKRFMAENKGSDVLLSAESLTEWLLSNDKLEALLKLLAAAREVTSTRCVWTVRRLDDLLGSAYLFMLRLGLGSKLPPPDEYFANRVRPSFLFNGMREAEKAVDGDVVYVKYDSAGAHKGELLQAFGMTERTVATIQAALELGPRRNARPSHKEAIVLANIDALSTKAGVELNLTALREAFKSGDFKFRQDWCCQPVDEGVKRSTHNRALAVAREQGFTPYVEFFENDEVDVPSPAGLNPEMLTDEDLERLVGHLGLAPSAQPKERAASST